MANKVFRKAFTKEFTGISGECSALEPESGEVNRAVNYEYSVGNSLRGRVGCQGSGTHKFFAIFPYKYSRTQDQYDIVYQVASGTYPNQVAGLSTTKTTADGSSIEKLIAINQQVWMLDTMNITITQVTAGTYQWYLTPTSGGVFQFHIKRAGVEITGMPQSAGDSIFASRIWDMLGLIDSTADLSVSRTTRGVCPPFAIVNGNQTTTLVASYAYGDTYSVTVDAGHNFQVGDIITFNSDTNPLVGGMVRVTTATTITYLGPQVTVSDNAVLGYMGQSFSNFPVGPASSETSGAFVLSIPYWRLIPEGDGDFGTIYDSAYAVWAAKTSSSFYAPPTAENAAGNLYIAASSAPNATGDYANELVKLDGRQVSRAGLPEVNLGLLAGPAAGSLTGTYKYTAQARRYDAQGNIWEGPLATLYDLPLSITLTSQGCVVSASLIDPEGFDLRGGAKNTTEAPTAGQSFYVDVSGAEPNLIQPGDVVLLTDNTAQLAGLWTDVGLSVVLGTLHRTVCTSYTAQAATISPTSTSMTVEDSSGYTINDNTAISTGLTVVFYRTTAGGNQYYKLAEVPISLDTNPSFIDDVTDAVLITQEQLIQPEIGKEHNPPPQCTLVCQHQGGLVVARGSNSPNTVAFSTADGLEYFPTASNSFDVPSTQSGFITAIASDTIDRLAVFKERAYYDVAGDLDAGSFSVNVKNEGDFGITSQASLVRASGVLIGLSKNGWITINDGILDPYKFKSVNARLINQNYYFNWAVGVNDYFNRQYVCSIPTAEVGGSDPTYVIDYSRDQIIVLERSSATTLGYANALAPSGGMAMIGDTLFHLGREYPYTVFRRLPRFNGNSPGTGDGDSFYDASEKITYILESQAINFGEPGLLKSPIRIRTWSIPNDYVVEGWVPFSVLVETAGNPLAQYIGSGGTGNTSATITFSAETDVCKDIKLKKQKVHFYLVRFTTSAYGTAPFITGYEIMFAENYDKEDFVK